MAAYKSDSVYGPPTAGNYFRGDTFVDASGNTFYCMATGNPGYWGEEIPPERIGYDRADTPTIINTAGDVTYTAAQILSGAIYRDAAGVNRSDTLPTATLLVGALLNPQVGDRLVCTISNTTAGAFTVAVAAGSGGALGTNIASAIVGQNSAKTIQIRITNVSSPAYVFYM